MNYNRLFITVSLMLFCSNALLAADPKGGQVLFQGRCASCHSVTKKITGPALMGVEDRHPEGWIISFVKGSQAMIKSGDKAALEVFNQNNQIVMPDHPDLNDEQIRDILAFVKVESANA